MGYVFTPQEFKEGRIPKAADYLAAKSYLLEALRRLASRDIIYGAILHGSNFHSDGGVGSDIDVLVVYEENAEEHLRRLRNEMKSVTGVPVEFVPVRKQAAEGGYHGLDWLYVSYIKEHCKNGVVGCDPINAIAPQDSWKEPKKEVEERFKAQLEGLAKQKTMLPQDYNEARCDFAEKLILKW